MSSGVGAAASCTTVALNRDAVNGRLPEDLAWGAARAGSSGGTP
jgi:hypothetical protein